MPRNAPKSNPAAIYDQAREAADVIGRSIATTPQVGIISGSGLGSLADALDQPIALPYTAIPHMLPPTVAGHDGQLVLGTLAGIPVAVLRGRLHLYEGYTPQQITFPLRVLGLLGIKTCILTNAAGGLNSAIEAGSLMMIRDHIGFPSMAGLNPLSGPNDERFGPRFPAMTDAYDPALREKMLAAASQHGVALAEGVYAMVSGPNFETQAELRMLRGFGADAVGMSTVPEVIVARQMGIRVLAFSIITNLALAETGAPEVPDHEHVLRMAAETTGQLTTLLQHAITQLI
ncbi:MAG TPA: purine-nucleoside phosphorylase [Ktedonobacterales bacterium]|nr:purine-nucleoside phosphorylase [Ktedonobacterales bacterium]